MEIQQLRHFIATARELNVTPAEEDCNASQPSLTRAIGLLEADSGGDLFRREQSLAHLTDQGQRLVPLLAQCIENAHEADHVARASPSGNVLSLWIAIREGVPSARLVPHLLHLAHALVEFGLGVVSRSVPESTRDKALPCHLTSTSKFAVLAVDISLTGTVARLRLDGVDCSHELGASTVGGG